MSGQTGSEAPELTVLIVSHNTRDLTAAALASLAEGTAARHEVVVADNASADGSAERIARDFPAVRLLPLPENLGFARASNLAAREARGRLLLLLNPDTVVLPGAVDALLAFAGARPGARIWGGRTLWPDGRLNPRSCWSRITLWSAFCGATGLSALRPRSAVLNPEALPAFARDHEREVDIVAGCFLLIERSLWEVLGGFDPAFFVYGEEADLCLRGRALGARPAVTPQAVIVHVEGASRRDEASQRAQILAARIGLARRHLPLGRRRLAAALMQAGAVGRILAWRLSRDSGRRVMARRLWEARAAWWAGY